MQQRPWTRVRSEGPRVHSEGLRHIWEGGPESDRRSRQEEVLDRHGQQRLLGLLSGSSDAERQVGQVRLRPHLSETQQTAYSR